MAAIANLTIDQGANFNSDVTVKDANGNPFVEALVVEIQLPRI